MHELFVPGMVMLVWMLQSCMSVTLYSTAAIKDHSSVIVCACVSMQHAHPRLFATCKMLCRQDFSNTTAFWLIVGTGVDML